MSRRHTVSHKSSPNDYPEHLNPFRDEDNQVDETNVNNKFNTVGRRNSRLASSFRMRSWSIFSSKKSKSTDQRPEEPDPMSPNSNKAKFSTLTPKISRQILDVLSPKKSKNKLILTSASRYGPTETTNFDFIITPKSSRETSAKMENKQECTLSPIEDTNEFSDNQFRITKRESVIHEDSTNEPDDPKPITSQIPIREIESPSTDELSTTAEGVDSGAAGETEKQPKPEPRMTQPPVPLPRTIISSVRSRYRPEIDGSQPSTSEDNGHQLLINTPSEVKYVKQGAKPKKKRKAPPPPASSTLSTNANHKQQINQTDLDTSVSPSLVSSISSTTIPSEPASYQECLPPTIEADDI